MPGREGLSESLEDYLEAIFHIIQAKRVARAKEIAGRLKVKSSSVTGALHALAERGLINYAPYDVVTLTARGEEVASDVVHRHEVLREFFLKVLCVGEAEADDAACRMEHAVSPEIVDRFVRFARFMRTSPEGEAWIRSFAREAGDDGTHSGGGAHGDG